MPKYDVVVFDMDGTILDTLTDLTNCINILLKGYGCPERTLAEIKGFVGNGIKMLLRRSFPEGKPLDDEKLFDEYMNIYKEHCADFTKAYDGIPKAMRLLRDGGVKVAIVSNKPDLAVNKLAERFFDGLYDIAVGEMPCLNRKPAPDEVFYALEKLGIGKERAVYVGDSDVDLMTAKNSGLDCISVSWGFKTRGFLEELGAKTIIDSPKELCDIVL